MGRARETLPDIVIRMGQGMVIKATVTGKAMRRGDGIDQQSVNPYSPRSIAGVLDWCPMGVMRSGEALAPTGIENGSADSPKVVASPITVGSADTLTVALVRRPLMTGIRATVMTNAGKTPRRGTRGEDDPARVTAVRAIGTARSESGSTAVRKNPWDTYRFRAPRSTRANAGATSRY